MTKISDLPAATSLDGTELVPLLQAGVDVTGTVEDLRQLAAQEPNIQIKHLDATQSNDTVTPVSITEFEQVLSPGTYRLDGLIIYQSVATTTGVQFFVNCDGGAVSVVNALWYQVTTGTTAANGIGDGATSGSAQLLEGKSQRVNNTASGATQGVDTANASVLAILDGIVVVTAETTLKIMFNSSVADSAITLQVGSNLLITKAP